MSSHPMISIILVNYKTPKLTIECLQSIYEHVKYPSFEVLLVDNASQDGSVELIRERFPQVHLIASDENLGFALANNVAAKEAKGEYLLLLNTDTLLLDDAITNLHEFAQERPEAGLWGGRTLFGDRTLNPFSCLRSLSIASIFFSITGLKAMFPESALFNADAYGGWQRDSVREVDIIVGCFLLIRRSIWDKLGGFDPLFFMYGDDADLCLRAKAIGCRPMITPKAVIIHYGGASEPLLARKETRLLASKVSLLRRHWREPGRSVGLFLLQAYPYTRAWVYSLAAKLSGNVDFARNSEVWRAVCSDRPKWAGGFEVSGPF